LLLIATFLVRGCMEEERSTGEAVLQAGRPTASTPLTIEGMEETRGQRFVAQARSLRVSSFAPDGGSVPDLELVVPVSTAVCDRAERVLRLSCGKPTPVTASALTFDWDRVTSLRADVRGPEAMTLNSVASAWGSELRTWAISPLARRVRIEFPCLRAMGFSISLPEMPMRAECELGGRPLRLKVEMPRSLAPSLYIDGTRQLALRMSGSEVKTSVEKGVIAAGGSTARVKRREERIVFLSDSPDVRVDLAVGAGAVNRHLEVAGPSVESALLAGREILPTAYEDAEAPWLTVMGTLLGVTLGTLGALLVGWPRRKEK
jgi:hypothetical protein